MKNPKVAIAIAGAVVVILALIGLLNMGEQDGTDQQAETGAPAATQEDPETAVAVVPKAQVESKPAAESEPAAAAESGATVKPSFDIVRVEPTGETVIAGRSAPGSEVTILDGDTPIGTAKADEAGEFVLLPEQPLKPGTHELSLEAKAPPVQDSGQAGSRPVDPADSSQGESGAIGKAAPVQSENVVIVVVPEPKVPAAEATETAQVAQSGDAAQEDTSGKVIAVLTPREGTGGSRVLQQTSSDDGIAHRDLLLNAIDYDESGRVIISGMGPSGALVIVYLDNRSVGQTRVGENGRWRLVPANAVEPGLHRLRVDQVDETGKVVARVETPFSRSTVLATLEDDDFVVVQPGNSLWRIARRRYGQGIQYTLIYEANLNQIGDPDLIYPGQIFAVPASN